jgi:hypothetical protein
MYIVPPNNRSKIKVHNGESEREERREDVESKGRPSEDRRECQG